MELEKLIPSFIPSPSFDRLIRREDTTIDQILNEMLTFRLFRQDDSRVVRFFVKRADQLLNLAFASEETHLSSKAFAILEHGHPEVTAAMLKHQRFHNTAVAVLARRDANHLHLSRLASLTLAVVMVDQRFIMTSCGFILQMLSFAWETSVFSLFEYLCSENEENKEIQEWLIRIGFIQVLHKEVDDTEMTIGKDRLDQGANLMCSYLALIRICAKNKVFDNEICSHNFVVTLNMGIGDYAPFVEDARWMALEALYRKSTVEMMRGLFQSAIEVISDTQCATQTTVAAVRILNGMLEMDDVIRPFIAEADVPMKIVSLMLANPDHTIVHGECRHFLIDLIGNASTKEKVLTTCLSSILEAATSDNRCLSASMIDLMTNIWKVASNNTKLRTELRSNSKWNDVWNNVVSPRNALIKANYGGSVQAVVHEAPPPSLSKSDY